MPADRLRFWKQLEMQALAQFGSHAAAKRFLTFLDRTWGFLRELENRLASPPSSELAQRILSKRGRGDTTWSPLREIELNEAAAKLRFDDGCPWHEAFDKNAYAQLPKIKKSHAWKIARRGLGPWGRHQAVALRRYVLESIVARYREIAGKHPPYTMEAKAGDGGAAVSFLRNAMDWAFYPRSSLTTASIVKYLKRFKRAPSRLNPPKGKLLLLLIDHRLAAVEADARSSHSHDLLIAVRSMRAPLRPFIKKIRMEEAVMKRRTRRGRRK